MNRVLVGADGSASGEAALGWATAVAKVTGSELVIARVWHPGFAEVAPDVYEELRAEARSELADQWCAPAHDAELDHRALLLEGDPRDQLLAAAKAEDADLLVVGARGAGSHPHALHLGSVTHHLVHHTDRPLAAIPASAQPEWPDRMIVGVDGSPGSAAAVDWCCDLAAAPRTEVIALYAELPLIEVVPRTDAASWYQVALGRCHEWARPLRDGGIATREMVVAHEPEVGLTEAGIRERAGLIVVGTRGAGGISGLRLGSTALKVLHRSGLPVVLVPTGS